jgi:peroxiredoxin
MKEEFAKKYDTEVVAATVEPMETTAPLAERLNVTYPIMTDTSHEVSEAYGVYDLPGGMGPFSAHSMFLIDKEGRIRWKEVSVPEMYIQPETIREQVRELARQEG